MNGITLGRRSLLAAATTLASPVPWCRAADRGKPLRLLTNWFAQAEHGGFYQAQALGLYDKAGIDAVIGMGGAQVNTVQLLLAGQCDVALAQPEQVLDGIAHGLPLVAVATTFQKGIGGLLAHPDITDLAQLRGHPILISPEGRITYWPWLRARYGFTDDQAAPYTFNIQPFLFNPRLAMQAFATSEPYAVQQRHVPYRFFLLADAGYPGFGNMLVTTRATLAARGAALAAFLHASMTGWKDVLTGDAAPARRAIMAANPQMTADQIDWSFAELRRLQAVAAPGQYIGRFDPAAWQRIRDRDIVTGLIPASLDWRSAFTTEFDSAMDVTL
ncbi:ABC transporter substrate-binding protein [Lichenicoccus sp.]|uniref:ABC transporter substrate-binding protein n=1 Tax=Lichenicoccus sp. TaxID=2781899 RepID=UPI003D11AA51